MAKFFLQAQQVAIAFDQFLGTLIALLIFPITQSVFWADETISSWAYRAHKRGAKYGFLMHTINLLFIWQADIGWFYWRGRHCKEAYASEQERTQQAPELRK